MNERRDDTTKPDDASRPSHEQSGYYYDDATGYETYEPEEVNEDKAEDAPDEVDGQTRCVE